MLLKLFERIASVHLFIPFPLLMKVVFGIGNWK